MAAGAVPAVIHLGVFGVSREIPDVALHGLKRLRRMRPHIRYVLSRGSGREPNDKYHTENHTEKVCAFQTVHGLHPRNDNRPSEPNRLPLNSQKSKSNPSIKLLELKSVPNTAKEPGGRIHEYSYSYSTPPLFAYLLLCH